MVVEPRGFGVEGVGNEPPEGHRAGLGELERQSQRRFKRVAAQPLASDARVHGEAHEQNARNRESRQSVQFGPPGDRRPFDADPVAKLKYPASRSVPIPASRARYVRANKSFSAWRNAYRVRYSTREAWGFWKSANRGRWDRFSGSRRSTMAHAAGGQCSVGGWR